MIAHDLTTVRHLADHTVVMYLGKIVEYAPTKSLFEDVRDPYTMAPFSAVLIKPSRQEDEIVLTGKGPSPLSPPSGCRVHPRCPFAMPRRSSDEPTLQEVKPGHRVACHLYDGA